MRQSGNGSRDLSETFLEFLNGCAKVVFGIGVVISVIAVGLLVFTCFRVTGEGGQQIVTDAINNVAIFEKALFAGLVGVAVGSTYLFWGEEFLGVGQLISAAALFFAPLYLPSLLNGNETNQAVREALHALQQGGTLFGVISLAVLLVDLAIRVKSRAVKGVKTDYFKYGKGVKEEKDRQNVFMGKCWQLPFCRKFVRERCPIYHAKRTCWKEQVGCMCEEQVIRDAMEQKAIPKDQLLAANYIPKNHRLTQAEKFERCKSCIIYNEHQRHKYRLWLPGTVLAFILFYALLHGPLIAATQVTVDRINQAVNSAMISKGEFHAPTVFVEGLLVVFLIVTLSYALKVLEYVIFKLKL